jgi:hypothetical protein
MPAPREEFYLCKLLSGCARLRVTDGDALGGPTYPLYLGIAFTVIRATLLYRTPVHQ